MITIGNYEFSQLPSLRWQVKRGDFIMAVFGSRAEAEGYTRIKHDAEANDPRGTSHE